MKFSVFIITLLLCCSLNMAKKHCPSSKCFLILKPVCATVTYQGEEVTCKFGNECFRTSIMCRSKLDFKEAECNPEELDDMPNCQDYVKHGKHENHGKHGVHGKNGRHGNLLNSTMSRIKQN